MKLDSNYHSVFKLTYHLVLVVKYRRKVINVRIASRIRKIGEYIATNYNITFLEFNHDCDHAHILFSAHPKSALSKYINAFKSASSRLIKKEFPEIRKILWKEYFWSRSFCLLTTGGAPIDVIKKYIESQGEKK
jgi:putative transposase